ncbi:MAG: hypothetical protein OIF50_04685 [Flavobacteriaceae bacterium]|nr:hypothetical protein [Flavobacteriaceae bacterium]
MKIKLTYIERKNVNLFLMKNFFLRFLGFDTKLSNFREYVISYLKILFLIIILVISFIEDIEDLEEATPFIVFISVILSFVYVLLYFQNKKNVLERKKTIAYYKKNLLLYEIGYDDIQFYNKMVYEVMEDGSQEEDQKTIEKSFMSFSIHLINSHSEDQLDISISLFTDLENLKIFCYLEKYIKVYLNPKNTQEYYIDLEFLKDHLKGLDSYY